MPNDEFIEHVLCIQIRGTAQRHRYLDSVRDVDDCCAIQ